MPTRSWHLLWLRSIRTLATWLLVGTVSESTNGADMLSVRLTSSQLSSQLLFPLSACSQREAAMTALLREVVAKLSPGSGEELTVVTVSDECVSTDDPPSPAAPRRSSWWQWLPTDADLSLEAERHVLSPVRLPCSVRRVALPPLDRPRPRTGVCGSGVGASSMLSSCNLGPSNACNSSRHAGLGAPEAVKTQEEIESGDGLVRINTLVIGSGPPLVLIHGMAAGLGLWVANLESLAEVYTVYALDLPGFGRSDRVAFEGSEPQEGEAYFVDHVEAWRCAMGLDEPFSLLGHSMGGYLAAAYATRYPHYVRHLLLEDPWGVDRKPEDWDQGVDWHWRVFANVMTSFNPLAFVRLAGPWGPDVLLNFHSDLAEKYRRLFRGAKRPVLDYIYHINALKPEGEDAFATMTDNFAWSKRPLLERLPQELPKTVPVSIVWGSDSWLDVDSGRRLAEHIGATFTMLPGGHHLHIECLHRFNEWALTELAKHAPPTNTTAFPVPAVPNSHQ
eukprot:TRINITY_DN18980_c0_g1_i1.p1 TRINITY_DN18980_c0_g1~~TRINITY_DN18980_c0_g1_i1.p1  ORF type:complete len:504 (-),score=48.04 TRINITY_DN18980_c0_g1_i1:124-1635(-)